MKKKILFVVNVDWFFISHRLPIALEAIKHGFEVHVATSITTDKKILSNYGINIHEINFNRKSQNIFNIIIISFKLAKVIKLINPDIVHLITIKPVIIGGFISSLLGIKALVISITGLGYTFIANGFIANLRKFFIIKIYNFIFLHKNLKIIFQNNDDLKLLTNRLTFNKVVLIKGSGVNLSLFKYTKLPNEKSIVMMASRLIKDKGLIEFLNAAQILKNKGLNARFVLIGNIDNENPSVINKNYINKHIEKGNIEWWGHRNNMHQVVSLAHLIVLPSYREGMPKILLEAAACGRAVITTDVPGCKDAIIANITGLLVPVRNHIELADKIEYLINRPDKLVEMGLAGRKLAEDEFDIKDVINKHISIYNELLDKI